MCYATLVWSVIHIYYLFAVVKFRSISGMRLLWYSRTQVWISGTADFVFDSKSNDTIRIWFK
jgi:hypothetical protein